MANTDVNKYPYTGQADQNPYGGVSIENLVAVISALLPKGGNNSSGQNIYAGVSPAGLAEAVGLGNIQSNNSAGKNIYKGVSAAGLVDAVTPPGMQSNNSPAGNIYGGVSIAGLLDALRFNQSTPDPKTARDMQIVQLSEALKAQVAASSGVAVPEGSSLVSQIPTEMGAIPVPSQVPVPEIANNVVDPSQLMRIEKGSYGPASTETPASQQEGNSTTGKSQGEYQYSGNKPLRKDQEILDKYSSGDITASVVNGQLHLTNQGPGSLQRQTDQAKAGQLNAEVISFQEKMKAIQEEPDLSTREAMLNTFQADVGEIQTKELNKFRAIAEGQLGIPTLRQQLASSEMTDKQDPYYHMFLSDSPQTMKIRQALAIAEQRAMGQTQELATRDPMFIRRGLEVKGFIDRQNRFITDRYLQESRITDRKEMKEEDRDAAAQQVIGAITPQGLEILRTQFPGTEDKEVALRALPLMKGPRKEEWAAVLDPSQTPQGLLRMSVLGSAIPDSYIVKKQSDATGESPAAVQQDLERMKKTVAGDGKALYENVQKFGTAEEKKTFKALYESHVAGLTKGKEAQAQWQDTKAGWMIDMMGRAKANAFFGNVNGWSTSLRSLPDADKILDKGEAVDLTTFLQEYALNAPAEQRAARMQAVQQIATKEADRINSGIYGAGIVDKGILKAKIAAATIMQTGTTAYSPTQTTMMYMGF
jgi:hypothetical protein